MTIDEFWSIIEDVHRASAGDMARKCELLKERLARLDADALRSFRQHFDTCDERAYDWGLWGAAYVVQGGCSDDSFADFRSTLISDGRSVFESALSDPDSWADLGLSGEDAFYEGFAYVVTEAEKQAFGAVPERRFPDEPSGEEWAEDDETGLANRFPKLFARYWAPRMSSMTRSRKKPWWKLW